MMSAAIEPAVEVELPEQYELVNGEVREIPPMGLYSAAVANRLNMHLSVYAMNRQTGLPWMDIVYRLPLPEDRNRNRKPDVAFASFERWAEDRPLPYRGNPIDVVPELMVEVVSPTDTAEDVIDKAFEYLRAGANLVWVIYPRVRKLHAYSHPSVPPQVFGERDLVEAPEILPGFSVPLAALFPPLAGRLPPIPDDVPDDE